MKNCETNKEKGHDNPQGLSWPFSFTEKQKRRAVLPTKPGKRRKPVDTENTRKAIADILYSIGWDIEEADPERLDLSGQDNLLARMERQIEQARLHLRNCDEY